MGEAPMHVPVAAVAFASVVCLVFVALTCVASVFPPYEMDAVVLGLALFVVPFAAVFPPAALLWAACLLGAWLLSDAGYARRVRAVGAIPDRVPEEWRAG